MRILYISTNFTSVTHSFITREISHLQAAGESVGLLSLRSHAEGHGVDRAECDLSRCRFAYPISPAKAFGALAGQIIRRPIRTARAIRLFLGSTEDSWRTRLKSCYQLGVAASCLPWIESEHFDHIHAHFASSPASFALCIHFLTGLGFSFTGHAADIFREGTGLRLKLAHAAGVVCISEYNQRYYESLIGPLANWQIVHCGVDTSEFAFRLRNAVGTPVRILSVGRLVPKKGFVDLLAGIAMLRDQGIPVQVDIVGDGPLKSTLESQATVLDLPNVTFHGALQQAKIRELLQDADLFCLMCAVAEDGDRDNIPVSLMEAMAAGCPVITTDVAAISELVGSDGSYGVLLNQRDSAGMASAIIHLVKHPEDLSRLSSAGRSRVEQNFNIATENDKLRSFFRGLACPKGA